MAQQDLRHQKRPAGGLRRSLLLLPALVSYIARRVPGHGKLIPDARAEPSLVSRLRNPFVLIFLLGALLRGAQLFVPFNGSVVDSWRECDVAGIARNFAREDMNILEPRIDWRGDGPGLVESEFPIFPWSVAALYRVFGEHDILGRIIAWLISWGGLAVALALAQRLLSLRAALIAGVFVALSPLGVRLGTAMQPDGLMWLGYVGAAYAFLRWLDDGGWRWYSAALVATAVAILAKASAAHIGFLLLALLLDRRGFAALRDLRVWAFAVVALLPGALWYLRARGYYHEFGNSLGISSEDHWVGRELLTHPRFALRVAAQELVSVWTPAGVLLAAAAVVLRRREYAVRVALYWIVAAAIFYLAAARTTGDSWAAHYHIMTVMPVALLIGSGTDALLLQGRGERSWLVLGVSTLVIALLVYVLGARAMVGTESAWFQASGALLAMAAVTALIAWRGPARIGPVLGVAALLAVLVITQGRAIISVLTPRESAAYACSAQFAAQVPPGTLIAAAGDRCFDETGHRTAYEAPFYFYWMNRKGWSVCTERQSVETLQELAGRGAQFYVAHRGSLAEQPELEARLRAAFPVVAECDHEVLFRISPAVTP